MKREHYLKNREHYIEYSKKYCKDHKDAINERRRKRYAENPEVREKELANCKKWYEKNKTTESEKRKLNYQVKKLKEQKELLQENIELRKRVKLHDIVDEFVTGHEEVKENLDLFLEKFKEFMLLKDKEDKNID